MVTYCGVLVSQDARPSRESCYSAGPAVCAGSADLTDLTYYVYGSQKTRFLQLQQQAAAHMNAKQYTDALVAVDQSKLHLHCGALLCATSHYTIAALTVCDNTVLQLQPNHHIAKELQKVLTEKIELGR